MYVEEVAPAIAVHPVGGVSCPFGWPPVVICEEHWYHWYVINGAGYPPQVPGIAVSIEPVCKVPVILGAFVGSHVDGWITWSELGAQ